MNTKNTGFKSDKYPNVQHWNNKQACKFMQRVEKLWTYKHATYLKDKRHVFHGSEFYVSLVTLYSNFHTAIAVRKCITHHLNLFWFHLNLGIYQVMCRWGSPFNKWHKTILAYLKWKGVQISIKTNIKFMEKRITSAL